MRQPGPRAGSARALACGAAGLVLAGGLAVPAAGATPAVAADGMVRLVVLSDVGTSAQTLARDLGASDLSRQGLEVTTPPTRYTFTVEVPAGEVPAVRAALAERPGVAAVAPLTSFTLTDTPDDHYYSYQQRYLKALHLPKAWSLTHGSSQVRIAVIDSGVDVGHPDLSGKVAGTYNAVDGGSDVTDQDSEHHGTRVASMAAAATDNGKGIAGSGWSSTLLAVKVEDELDAITNQAVADGIHWAVDHGAEVLNLSLGGSQDDEVTRSAVKYAVDHDVVVVAAAGNDGVTQKFYPAADPGVLAVGATGPGGGTRAPFSQHGKWVDVAAPGVGIWGADAGKGYSAGDGTSFASPLVAGVAGLVRAFRPELSAVQVQKALVSTTGPSTLGFGHGLVDAAAALAYRPVFPGPPSVKVVGGSPVSGDATVKVSGIVDPLVTDVRARLLAGGPTVPAAVAAGAATLTLPTAGTAGSEVLRVVTCRKTVCSSSGTDVSITVDNPVPVLTSPDDGSEVSADFTVAARVDSVDAPMPAVRFLADGHIVLGTDTTGIDAGGGRWDFSVPVSIHALGAGPHTITAVACDTAGTTCATDAPSAGRTLTVDRLTPVIQSTTPTPFSPNGDGRKDTSTVRYTLDVASDVTLSVERADGSTFLTRHLGRQGAGRHSWVWNGKGAAGAPARSGTYTVVLDTATSSGPDLVGQARKTVIVDLARPRLSGRAASHATVYPVKDGYVDSIRLSVRTGEPTASVTVTVTDSRQRRVWASTRKGAGAGTVAFTFNGRRASGTLLAAAGYHFVFTATDRAGNQSTSSQGRVAVSHRHLSATRTGHRTVSPYGSFDYFVPADESHDSVVWRTRWGAGSLLWEPAGGRVTSYHHAKLPRAAVYGTLRINAYGRGSKGATAFLYNLAPSGDVVRSTYSATTGTHAGRKVSASRMLKGQRIRWAVEVMGSDTYEVKTFTITWTYRVLL